MYFADLLGAPSLDLETWDTTNLDQCISDLCRVTTNPMRAIGPIVGGRWLAPPSSTIAKTAPAIPRASSAVAKAARPDGRSDRKIGLACRIHGQKAVLAFAVAGRFNALD